MNKIISNIKKSLFSKLIILSLIIKIYTEEKDISNIAVIPFKTYLPINYDITNPVSQLINSFVYRKTYLNIEVQSGQKIPMFLNFEQVQMHTSNIIAYFRNDDDIHQSLYTSDCSHICNFDFVTSFSYKQLSDFNNIFYNWRYCIASEQMIFYKDLEEKEKSYYEIKFIHDTNKTNICILTGLIDTQSPKEIKFSLFHQIKDLINSKKFTWSFDFKGQNEGKFIIGDIIDNDKLNFYNENKNENFIQSKQYRFGLEVFWRIYPEKIYIGNYVNETYNQYFSITIHNRYISVTEELFNDIKKQFLIDEEICSEEVTDYYYRSIYCNKKKYLSLTDNYKKLPNFTIFLKERYNITFSPKDLFLEKGDYIYFFIRELRPRDHRKDVKFSIGSILFEKYVVVFDDEASLLYILQEKTSPEEPEKDNTTLKIVLICVLSFVLCGVTFVIIGKLYGKKLFGDRKKKANELLDDYFEYTPENINDKDNKNGLLDDNDEKVGNNGA